MPLELMVNRASVMHRLLIASRAVSRKRYTWFHSKI